jgi:hypothetical protein
MNLAAQSLNLIVMLSLVITHLFAYKLKFLAGIPRSIWLSMAGGITVSYVFIHLYPELKFQEHVIESHWLQQLKHPRFIFILLGVSVFYGVERMVEGDQEEKGEASLPVFWLHICFFAIYNLLLGYVISFKNGSLELKTQFIFLFSYVLHFLVNDFGMQFKHTENYKNKGRWLLAAGIFLGWLLAKFVSLSEEHLILISAFLAGAITINMIKEELLSKRKSKFWPFLLAAILYTIIMVLIA